MEDGRINEIITELRSIRLQVSHLEQEIDRRDTRRVPALASERPPPTPVPATHVTHAYSVGDRVRILNKVKKPATWNSNVEWSKRDARRATVIEVRARQIFFTTDNGVDTWRAPNKLQQKIINGHE
jgi:hypothetical protein